MSVPVGSSSAPPSFVSSMARDRKLPIAPIVSTREDSIFEELLEKYGVRSPLRNYDGTTCQGLYKTARKTGDPMKVALLSSPYRTKQPDLYARVAEQEICIHQEVQDGPHIPRLYDHFAVRGKRYATIQQNVGQSLYTKYLDKGNPYLRSLPMYKLERICKQLLESIQYLHERGILHGDVKPENVGEFGDLFDFSLSEKIGRYLTHSPKYSNFYRPPEAFFGQGTGLPGDIWALGCLFFELIMKTPLIPILEPKNRSDLELTDIEMIHAFQNRFKIQFNAEDLHLRFPHAITVEESGNKKLKRSHLPPLPFFLDEIIQRKSFKLFADLLTRMLKLNPEERISAKEALTHPFFSSVKSQDHSFKLAVRGNRQMGLQIRNHCSEIVARIDLSTWRPSSCYHIYKSNHPLQLEIFPLTEPERIVQQRPFIIGQDHETIEIDTDDIVALSTDLPQLTIPVTDEIVVPTNSSPQAPGVISAESASSLVLVDQSPLRSNA
jgi:cyclin-dependent kinase